MMEKFCNKCGIVKNVTEFHYRIVKGRRYLQTTNCKSCRLIQDRERVRRRGYYPHSAENIANRAKKEKLERIDPKFRAKYIVMDSKKLDRRKKRENDLDLEFVQTLIAEGCQYCADDTLRL